MSEFKSELYKWLFSQRDAAQRYGTIIKEHFEKFDDIEDFTITFNHLQEYAVFLREMGLFGDEPFLWILRFLHYVASKGGTPDDFEKIKQTLLDTDKALGIKRGNKE